VLNDSIAAALGFDSQGQRGVQSLAESCTAHDAPTLAFHLWNVCGFRGDQHSYDAVQNSFVSEVIKRRRGIPITLAAIMIDVGAAIGIALSGIGMPGHFLVRETQCSDRYFDLFHGPRPIDESACRALLGAAEHRVPWSPTFLEPVSPAQMALRMLTNLKSQFRRTGDIRSLQITMQLRRHLVGPHEESEFAKLMRETN